MILIADDDPSVVASLSLLLKRHGHPARAARSQEEALRLLREQESRLVLQDMNFSRATQAGQRPARVGQQLDQHDAARATRRGSGRRRCSRASSGRARARARCA